MSGPKNTLLGNYVWGPDVTNLSFWILTGPTGEPILLINVFILLYQLFVRKAYSFTTFLYLQPTRRYCTVFPFPSALKTLA